MTQLSKKVVDLVYRTNKRKKEYLRKHPGETILAADGCKAIIADSSGEIRRGKDWVMSQRTVVILTDKKIVCGKWTIPLEEIEYAHLSLIGSICGSGQVLKLCTKDNVNYQLGMSLNREWTEQKCLSLVLEKEKVKTSLFSVLVRVIFWGILVYYLLASLI